MDSGVDGDREWDVVLFTASGRVRLDNGLLVDDGGDLVNCKNDDSVVDGGLRDVHVVGATVTATVEAAVDGIIG